MTRNRVKLWRAVTFLKFIAIVVSLTFLAKPLISNKITLPSSDLLNLTEHVVNEPMKSIYKKIYQYSIYPSLM